MRQKVSLSHHDVKCRVIATGIPQYMKFHVIDVTSIDVKKGGIAKTDSISVMRTEGT